MTLGSCHERVPGTEGHTYRKAINPQRPSWRRDPRLAWGRDAFSRPGGGPQTQPCPSGSMSDHPLRMQPISLNVLKRPQVLFHHAVDWSWMLHRPSIALRIFHRSCCSVALWAWRLERTGRSACNIVRNTCCVHYSLSLFLSSASLFLPSRRCLGSQRSVIDDSTLYWFLNMCSVSLKIRKLDKLRLCVCAQETLKQLNDYFEGSLSNTVCLRFRLPTV